MDTKHINCTTLQVVISQYEERTGLKFKPEDRFYQMVQINPKRFGQLLKGTKPIYGFEALTLSNYFGVSAIDFL